MKRKFSVLMALLLMAALCGCAGGTGESSEDKSSNAPSTTVESQAESSVQEDANTEEVTSSEAAPVEEGKANYGGKVVVGVQQDIDSLDPHKATAAGTKEILFNIFEGLVKVDENGTLNDAVASAHEVSEDGLVYTFTLRDGVKFHNGNNVTAEDVKYSLDRASGLLDGTPLISTLSVITSVDILDEKTVQVTVGSANTELIYSFDAAIIPAGSGESLEGTPIGTGPFSFVSYKPQEGIVLAKNPNYWQAGLPYLDEVTFKIVGSAETAMMELKGGSIDIYPYLTDSQANELASQLNIISAPSSTLQALFFNNAEKPLDDVRVRQAVCYALDKDMINEFVMGGRGQILSVPMLPALKEYYSDQNDMYGSGANIEKAKELLTEAGYPDGVEFTVKVPSNYEVHVQTTEVLAEQLKDAGINVKIEPIEWSTWLEDVYNGRKYQASVCALTGDTTPGYAINRFQSDHKKNFCNFSSEAFDEAAKIAIAELDPVKKAQAYKDMQKIFCEEAGSAFTVVGPITIAINPALDGYKFYPIYVQDMSTVYFK